MGPEWRINGPAYDQRGPNGPVSGVSELALGVADGVPTGTTLVPPF